MPGGHPRVDGPFGPFDAAAHRVLEQTRLLRVMIEQGALSNPIQEVCLDNLEPEDLSQFAGLELQDGDLGCSFATVSDCVSIALSTAKEVGTEKSKVCLACVDCAHEFIGKWVNKQEDEKEDS